MGRRADQRRRGRRPLGTSGDTALTSCATRLHARHCTHRHRLGDNVAHGAAGRDAGAGWMFPRGARHAAGRLARRRRPAPGVRHGRQPAGLARGALCRLSRAACEPRRWNRACRRRRARYRSRSAHPGPERHARRPARRGDAIGRRHRRQGGPRAGGVAGHAFQVGAGRARATRGLRDLHDRRNVQRIAEAQHSRAPGGACRPGAWRGIRARRVARLGRGRALP